MNIGAGDCTAIVCPGGDIFIVDMGSLNLGTAATKQAGAPEITNLIEFLDSDDFFGRDKRLAGLILTHPDRDHYNRVGALYDLGVGIKKVYHSSLFGRYKNASEFAKKRKPSDLIREMCDRYRQKDSEVWDRAKSIARLSLNSDLRVLTYDPLKSGDAAVVLDIPTDKPGVNPPPVDSYNPTYGLRIHWEASCEIYLLCGDVRIKVSDDEKQKKSLRPAEGPQEINMGSIVSVIRSIDARSNTTAIHVICGDAVGETESFITSSYPAVKNVGLLRVAHHGSAQFNSSSKAFLAAMNPELAVISAPGFENGYGLPEYEVIERIEAPGTKRLGPPQQAGNYWCYTGKKYGLGQALSGDIRITGSHGEVIYEQTVS